ncbi:reverse transcriptase [Plakobranchus ocellatus]|uniref:Reverse transcriptase n=1 Tax=Plakobranchus ocellatus TaxID=259542 RepID=A0AAV4BHZ4_9GAST|nr:reverse transcriptase [Plakobranchus ocellatus]
MCASCTVYSFYSLTSAVLSSFQTAKYFLKSKGSTAASYFTRPDILQTPVSPSLVKNICSSAKMYKNELRNKQMKLNAELSAVALSKRHMAFQTAAAATRLREKLSNALSASIRNRV